jgi:hypothetical protein
MPVKENQFNLGQLWAPSTHNWMAPGAIKSTSAAYGQGLDLGALRVQNGIWEILWSRTPTQDNQSSSGWVPFEPSQRQMMTAANAFRRYGPGWSYGPGHNMHNEVFGYYQEVHGRKPTQMEQLDIEHNRGLWQTLLKAYNEKIGFIPGQPDPTKPDPVKPDPPKTDPPKTDPPKTDPPVTQPSGLPPLSPPEQRAAELMSLLPQYLQRSWMTPLVVEAVKAGRRAQDRVVQRVVAELKK